MNPMSMRTCLVVLASTMSLTACPPIERNPGLIGVRNGGDAPLTVRPEFVEGVVETVQPGEAVFFKITQRPEPFVFTLSEGGTVQASVVLDSGSDTAEREFALITVLPGRDGPAVEAEVRGALGDPALDSDTAVFLVVNDASDDLTVGRPGQGALASPGEIIPLVLIEGTRSTWDVAFTGGAASPTTFGSERSDDGLGMVFLASVTRAGSGEPRVAVEAGKLFDFGW